MAGFQIPFETGISDVVNKTLNSVLTLAIVFWGNFRIKTSFEAIKNQQVFCQLDSQKKIPRISTNFGVKFNVTFFAKLKRCIKDLWFMINYIVNDIG